jgi:hypothetical protein
MRWKKLARPLFLVVALVFIAYAARDLVQRWESGRVAVKLPLALLAAVPLWLAALLQACGWMALIQRMSGRKIPAGASLGLYFDSQLARYVPGMVSLPLVRMHGATRLGISPVTVGTSVLLEMASWTGVGGGLGFLMIAIITAQLSHVSTAWSRGSTALVVAFAGSVIVLLAVDRRRLPSSSLRALRLDGSGPLIPAKLPTIHLAYWAAWAAHGWLVGLALGAPLKAALSGSAWFVLAPVAGFVALAAPAGLGVREGVLYLGLSSVLGPVPAATAALLSRTASLSADLGIWLLARPFSGSKPRT